MAVNFNEIINPYLDKFPELSTRSVSNLIFKEHKLQFKDAEQVRALVRGRRGSKGKKSLNSYDEKYYTKEAIQRKYNLPPSIETPYEPYRITGNKALIFSDVHIPFHNIKAIETMFDYCKDINIDTVVINGDFMDCFSVSRFNPEPSVIRFKDEIKYTKDFLKELKKIFKNARIYYKFANHEKRLEDYFKIKAPEIFDINEFKLNILLDLYNIGIEYIEDNRYIILNNNLTIWHGHEFRNGITSPANPARTAFMRAKENSIIGHYHQSSEHSETDINGKVVTCWSLGCLSELHPAYMPLNRWCHGFAIYTKENNDFWHINNHRIIKGRVV
jgi:predicted phosphodiesterase